MADDGISETVSEKPKPRRGRPRVFSEAWESQLNRVGLFSEVKSPRARVNTMYCLRAMHVLGDEFPWLVCREDIMSGKGKWRKTILEELGRIGDDEALRYVAEQVCEMKPKSKVAVQLIRRWRLGKSSPGDCLALTDELLGLVNDYRRRHPDTTWQQVLTALENTADAVKEAGGRETVVRRNVHGALMLAAREGSPDPVGRIHDVLAGVIDRPSIDQAIADLKASGDWERTIAEEAQGRLVSADAV